MALKQEYDHVMVIDSGSGLLKAGLNDLDGPSSIMPSYIGHPKYKAVMPSPNQQNEVIGDQCLYMQGLLKLEPCIQHGIITNWKAQEQLWQYSYNRVGISSQNQPVILAEPPLTAMKQSKQMAQYFLETLEVPLYSTMNSAVLALYSTALTTGLVLDVGHGVTSCVPIVQGYSLTHSQARVDMAGGDVTNYFQQLLAKAGHSFNTSAEYQIVNKIKEKRCQLLKTTCNNVQYNNNSKYKMVVEPENIRCDPYILPDGRIIEIGKESYKSPEILFKPDEIGLEHLSVPDLVMSVVHKCDMDLRKKLLEKLVLSGGSSLLTGFPERLVEELKERLPNDLEMRLQANHNRQVATWLGAAIFSHLDSFQHSWINKQDYQEQGDRLLFNLY